ncbi:glutamate dehydrogenase [Pseudoalteromonas nigrifaciens]|uniref:Glutamate dehydrogenase n=3 Tax=Pseudoalteromonas TaxID=53246 RepID=Q3IGZ0_PSET1|nr:MULTISPECIES: NAD-glutamate dehydrogenase [Pseudoalteromonas]ASM54229.1 glutamate dehydrogenase [Pseudoalteromonas nigrifaciens]MBB1369513.1 NAD-glutamate dehydrogenase [Pseudoalteromonas sp. SR45-4]MBB1404737.1 NAD-glutamate dehydrogenase [Pseudoalteromonas sp. SG44-5]MBH0073027.1 NAD-glutamate dehydrogenase [Pseudoalteromonas sp. NZS127]MBH0092660.1 NAD-glutamate dehydrogenase [Pseudoalteromonas sp. SCQQ13]|tara:strand:- start:9342 stop:14171 length:4830 start_codon:yes stop_codon:yes gene_type:complete
MTRNEGQASVILDNVCKLIHKKVRADNVLLVEKFAKALYSNMSKEDLANRNDSDLYGAALSLWNSLEKNTSDDAVIRVFNPEVAKDGWQSSHTIVEIIAKDMPFLVDSVRMAMTRENIASHLLLHSPLKIQRDENDKISGLSGLKAEQESTSTKTVFFIEIDRQTDSAVIESFKQELESVLTDVSVAVEDWQPIREKLIAVSKELPKRRAGKNNAEVDETVEFLDWLVKDNFTLMGYRQYELSPIQGDYELKGVMETSLGLMKNAGVEHTRLLSELPEAARQDARSSNLLILTKTNSLSRVHRPAYIDYVGVKRFDDKGNVIGEDRFIGLFSSNFYNYSAADVPVLKSKIDRIMQMCDFAKGTHAYKAVLNILETYPRDELVQARESELLEVAMGVLQVQERDMCRLFVRKDAYGRFFSCMVYVPRERYNTALRHETQNILANAFNSDEKVEFTTYFSESTLARTHYTVRVTDNNIEYKVKDIENNLVEAARTWEDKLQSALLEQAGEARGNELNRKYAQAFARSYKDEVLPSAAVVDIEKLEMLNDENKLEMLFYRPQEEANSNVVRLSLFHKDEPIHLSDVMPMLENFGLRVVGETPYSVKTSDGSINWIMDFSMLIDSKGMADFDKISARFRAALTSVWNNRLENDGFNRLVLMGGLTGREASILRAYAKYMRQIGVTFSQAYIEGTFANYPHIAAKIVNLFTKKFSVKSPASEKTLEKLSTEIYLELENVANLDDDRIIRLYVDMIVATLRTSFFQKDGNGQFKSYVSFKIKPSLIPGVPLPLPAFEIFVYSPRIEGVHLRYGSVARGGLRWSDRREDFRTEVLGLVKAQQVKNAVIVPVGSKGGFVCKQLPTEREAFLKEGQECYKIFIRGLLDITDNIVQGEIVAPVDVTRHDGDDAYLVVAADKGTATFSDIANGIANEYNFWLGDAFASGGSVGYDHKKMGITARGAWESVKRHFREMDIDCQTTDFTVVAIGDMAGDVFGNGMLLSKHTRLQVAFNHMHIFIDPTPDAAATYPERERLFKLPRSSWEDFNKDLISAGGGVFSRAAKSITLSPEMKKMLGTKKASMTPTELIKAALMMDYDLLWNGGIGTYVKSSKETDADVGDRANDALRINGGELGAKVFGEGGNLGATQLGRIEFAAKGGRVNTDFIDNVGGVTCSDNEVNIKILLNGLVTSGDLTRKQRDELLYAMTDEVSKLVLNDCYRQTHTISITQSKGSSTLKEKIRFIHALEKEGKLNRAIEFIPSDEELAERAAAGKDLTRPELAILVSYSKMVLKESFVTDEITENPYYRQLLVNSFPLPLREKFNEAMDNHPLRKEIIATKLANQIVNDMGLNFMVRMHEETGANEAEIALCYSIASELFQMSDTWASVVALDNKIPAAVQTEMLYQLRRTVRRVTRWFLRHRNKAQTITQTVEFFAPTFADLSANLTTYMVDKEGELLVAAAQELTQSGVPAELANRITGLSSLFSAMDLAEISASSKQSIDTVSHTYFKLGANMGLHWFLEQITKQPVANHWQALARASYREELDWQQRTLAEVVLNGFADDNKDVNGQIEQWMDSQELLLQRWKQMLAEFRTSQTHDFAKFSVALRELMLLSHNCV